MAIKAALRKVRRDLPKIWRIFEADSSGHFESGRLRHIPANSTTVREGKRERRKERVRVKRSEGTEEQRKGKARE